MSLFLVTIPRGNLFYHGCQTSDRIAGFEWLAFEPEHAGPFGSSWEMRNPPDGPPPTPPEEVQRVFTDRTELRIPPYPPPGRGPPRGPQRGYVHTYKAARDLRILYTDGQAAAKGQLGTLDTQDLIILMDKNMSDPHRFGEHERAQRLCDYAQKLRFDGVLRTEAGFEIIYCTFEEGGGLDLVSVVGSPFQNETTSELRQNGFEWIRAVTQRYHGHEADRAIVDFSSMVSAFWYPVNRTNPDTSRPDLPRLVNASTEGRRALFNRVTELALSRPAVVNSIHWQAVADRIENLFGPRLTSLADPAATTPVLRRLLDSILNIFIDFSQPTALREDKIRTCSHWHLQRPLDSFTSWTDEDKLIFESFAAVTDRICRSLFALRDSLDLDTSAAQAEISELISWLGWTRWRGCGGRTCADPNQICLVSSSLLKGEASKLMHSPRSQCSLPVRLRITGILGARMKRNFRIVEGTGETGSHGLLELGEYESSRPERKCLDRSSLRK